MTTVRSPLLMGLAALVLTACAMAMGSVPPRPSPGDGAGEGAASFRCALVARKGTGGTRVEARLEAARPVSGTYDLRVRAGGAAIDQGGEFAAAAGEEVTLGEAQIGGDGGAIEATLTLTAGGRTTTCPLER